MTECRPVGPWRGARLFVGGQLAKLAWRVRSGSRMGSPDRCSICALGKPERELLIHTIGNDGAPWAICSLCVDSLHQMVEQKRARASS